MRKKDKLTDEIQNAINSSIVDVVKVFPNGDKKCLTCGKRCDKM